MRFAAIYGIGVGVLMVAQWAFFLASGQVPELSTEPTRFAFHLAGELITALLLIRAGIGLLTNKRWARSLYMVAAGMLLYTVIVSPGYFAQQQVWPLVGMFALLLVMALASLLAVNKQAA